MTKQHNKSKQGFTIIEVVLVLAIAGLIFLMVFVAFPALQRAQHDTQRTDDMGHVQSQLINWQNNHSSHLPKASSCTTGEGDITTTDDWETSKVENTDKPACDFLKNYMNSAANENNVFKDPSGDFYSIVISDILEDKSADASETGQGLDGHNSKITKKDDKVTIESDTEKESDAYDAHVMYVIRSATCDEDKAVPSAKNNFAILYRMEGSGVKCTNSGE